MKYIDSEKLIAWIKRLRNGALERQKNLEEIGQETVLDKMIAFNLNKVLSFITSLQQEQPEFPNGKFVFPKYLYARTKDNKTIDMSYAPQDMNAIEYIRNDFIQKEQPEVDIQKEIEEYFKGWHIEEEIGLTKPDGWSCIVDDLKGIARHFYERGQSTQYQKDRAEFAKLKAKEWQKGFDEGLNARKK